MNRMLTFDEVKIIELKKFNDSRGFFTETYNKKLLPPFEQSKLLRVVSGSIIDVFIDLREGSSTFEHYGAIELTTESGLLYIPEGFAHGFMTLSDQTILSYKVNNFFNKESELGIKWNDPFFSIDWPSNAEDLIISEKDNNLPFWSDIKDKVNF